jgi:NifU-like protein involved in Fe-S cluster formation
MKYRGDLSIDNGIVALEITIEAFSFQGNPCQQLMHSASMFGSGIEMLSVGQLL